MKTPSIVHLTRSARQDETRTPAVPTGATGVEGRGFGVVRGCQCQTAAGAWALAIAGLWLLSTAFIEVRAQTLFNVDFGAGAVSGKIGFAGTGQATNDFWNRYRHYQPKFTPGMPLVADGRLDNLQLADGAASTASLTVTNAPGVWGNASGDPMFDSYVFAPNGSNMVVTVTGLEPGRYQFYLYGHADADVSGEQNSVLTLFSTTNRFGPLAPGGSSGWQPSQGWREGAHYIVFRDVPVAASEPVIIEIAPGPGGIAVLNGLQILSRGTAPPRLLTPEPMPVLAGLTNLFFHEVTYRGALGSNEARFAAAIDVESRHTNELAAVLFEGDLALLSPKLPPGWRIVNQGRKFILFATEPGRHQFEVELAVKNQRVEPWNQIAFTGPPAAIATLSAKASSPDTEVQLQSGTALPATGKSSVQGVLGADQRVALRWQSGGAEIAREALVTVDSRVIAHINPATIRYTSQFRCEILQGRMSHLKLVLPADQALTRLEGESVRDWHVETGNGQELLTIQFIRPVDKTTTLILTTERALPNLPSTLEFTPPQPMGVQRESGALRLTSEDVVARVESSVGLRQVNVVDQEIAAYRFAARPAALRAHLTRVEPVLTVTARVHASLEDNRLLVRHDLNLNAAKAGIYSLELTPQPGFSVTEVQGTGIDDWKAAGDRLQIGFAQRMLGDRMLSVSLERALTSTPEQFTILPLRLTGAARETALVGAGSSAGVQLRTAALTGLREVPVTSLPDRQDELLAFRSEQPEWRLALSAERLAPRVVAEVFNLLTLGEGLVGGSATMRFAIFNQGVQQFRIRVPAHWRNLEFTGPNLRRKDMQEDVWTISLQDKVWGGYTLVITYDYAFDPKQAALNGAGAHALDVERESGTVAVTATAGLALGPVSLTDPLRPIDPSQLAESDRALITRPVLLAYRYAGNDFNLTVNLTRPEELAVLDAVADRAQLTSVLTETGEMLTQAGFMVKNNERQFQRFQLPPGATLWGVSVNGEPVKAEQDGDWLLVSLPRTLNRDQAFAVDIKYAQQIQKLGRLWPRQTALTAPKTDVPGTYAEWELFVPPSKRVSNFGGNMTVARGTTYGFREAWQEFVRVYRGLWHQHGAKLIVGGGAVAFVMALILWGRRRGFRGVAAVLGVFCVFALLAGMMLPALSKAKSKAQRIKSVNNLKQIGLAARIYAASNDGRLPRDFEQMSAELSTDRILFDPETGERYTYVGADKHESDPHAVLAYSGEKGGRREVVLVDGSVQQVTAAAFGAFMTQAAAGEEQQARARMGGSSEPELARRYGLPALGAIQPALPAAGVPAQNGPATAVLGLAASSPTPAGAPPPMAAGMRSLRIDVPRTGRAFHFTRVLNLSGEPPAIRFSMMSAEAFIGARMGFQLCAFLFGLGIAWHQWRRSNARARWLALGLGLALLATLDLLAAWRALGLALVVTAPAILIALAAWLAWRLLHKHPAEDTRAPELTEPYLGPVPPAAVGLLLLLVPLHSDCLGAPSLPPAPASSPISVVSAEYRGAAQSSVAQLDASIELLSASTNLTLLLFGEEVAVEKFTCLTGEASLVRQGNKVGVHLPQPGSASIQMKLLVKLHEESGRHRLEFQIPPALGSQLTLVVDEPEAEVDFPTAVSMRRAPQGQQTQVEAVLGATDRVSLAWTPRLKRASDTSTTAFVQQSALVTFGAGILSTRSLFDYQITQGELRQVRLALPPGQRLLRVSGDAVRSWDFAETDRQEILIDLVQAATRTVRLSLETEAAMDPLPASVPVRLPQAIGVKRTSGWIAVRTADELGLIPERITGLDRVEREEFARVFGEDKLALVSAWRFLQPDFDLVTRVELLQPRLEVAARTHITVGLDQVTLHSRFEYAITRAGVFTVLLALPAQARVENVLCPAMQRWSERTENGSRLLEVVLKQRTAGSLVLDLELAEPLTHLPPTLELAGPHPLGVEKLSGLLSVASDAGIGLKTAAVAGLAEIPAAALPQSGTGSGSQAALSTHPGPGWLAFKTLTVASVEPEPWRLSLATEAIESWVRAEIAHILNVGETLTSGRAVLRYEIQNAPAKEFRFKVPAGWQNVEVSGAGIRRRDHTNENWRVELQNRVRGEYRLTVHWEQPAAASEFVFTGMEAQDVERETGTVSFHVQAPLQLEVKQASEDLVRIDAGELPAWPEARAAAASVQTTALAYRYLRPGWRLELRVQRFGEAALLQALVERVRLQTVIADDGQVMTQMELAVRNHGRQHLAITLPPGATVWSAFVAGEPVRPARRGGQLLLPIEASGHDAPVSVELTYVGKERFPRTRGQVQLVSPRLDVPLKDARWELFLPPDYVYGRFGGSMSYERPDLGAMAQDFTLGEYRRQEAAKKTAQDSQTVDLIRQARNEIAAGNYKDTANKLNSFFSRAPQTAAAARELKQLEEDVSRVQSSNLLNAQQSLAFENSARFEVSGASQVPDRDQRAKGFQAGEEAKAAEQQVRQLQKAQAVAVVRVTPLRVNLPTRGLRHSFVQVLQTEVDKPLTLSFSASNDRQMGWMTTLLLWGGGFLVLWLAAAMALSFRPKRPPWE